MAINDLYGDGIAAGWDVRDASTFTKPLTLAADVVIVGTGAGGGTTAEILAKAGFKVLMIEEGPLKTSADFRDMGEARAYADLYQEASGRSTADGSITILQGRSVGGTTTVNWTSSFRTPVETLRHWAREHAVKGWSVEESKPWFDDRSERLGIAPWAMPPNANNAVLKAGCEKLGWEWHVIPRNVRGCWNSGYCGYGCPVNAKQSMLVSTVPGALQHGATLVHHLSVRKLKFWGDRVSGLECEALQADGIAPSGVRVNIEARHVVLAGGAINNPALLLRSGAADPHQRIGKRTFLHPVVFTMAKMRERVDGWYGAPQSIASDQFQWQGDFDTAPGFKMEVPPIYPALVASLFGRAGEPLAAGIADMPNFSAMLALTRDGFHEQSQGGRVRIDEQGAPVLDYPLTDYLFRGFRNALLRMAEAQFAGGAERVYAGHLDAEWATSWSASREQIDALSMRAFKLALGSAHVMGGCAMGEDARHAVVRSDGSHHLIENLSIIDGSVFPTSIGANPQLSIYALAARSATRLAERLGRPF